MSTFEIKSEIYGEKNYETVKLDDGKVLSKFKFQLPNNIETSEDSDGDLVLCRRKIEHLEIEHWHSTFLKFVGLQIWRGAFLLSDFIIANEKTIFQSKNILELGSGVGLTGIVAGFYADTVVCTDINIGGILEIIKSNINRNKKFIKANTFKTMELDFMASSNWSDEINKVILNTDIIFAADVIYDDDLTDAFIKTLEVILNKSTDDKQQIRKKCVYIALEKRYVFTVADMETCAPCYEYFLQEFHKLKSKNSNWRIESIPLDFPQYFEYDRTNALVLWKISN